MSSIYQQALGTSFDRLHPQLQKRFGITSDAGMTSISEGIMEEIWGGAFYMQPFLYFGTLKYITFPERGRNIPFSLQNYAYKDSMGRESVAWLRKFYFPKKVRRFDATMIYSADRNSVIDFLGKDRDLVTAIDMTVTNRGGIKLFSGPQTFVKKGMRVNIPMLFSGVAEAEEWYDDAEACFRIKVVANNRRFGTIFGYKGSFTTKYVHMNASEMPADVQSSWEGHVE